MTTLNLVTASLHLEADVTDHRILRFKNAVLARAETNKNKDEIEPGGITELAATIPMMPIDVEHDPAKNLGFFTAGAEQGDALAVDGVVWIDRCDALGVKASDIESGKYQLSVEAEAQEAECSVCGSKHTSISTYCAHLKRRAKYNARRILRGLQARGGAITRDAAGTQTTFNTSAIYMVASHRLDGDMLEDDPEEEMAEGEPTPAAEHAPEDCGDDEKPKTEAAVSRREDVTPADRERAEDEYGDVAYADPKNKKYPVDTEAHIRSAYSYIRMPKNRAKYSPEEAKAIEARIVRAWKSKIDQAGPPTASKTEGATMENEPEVNEVEELKATVARLQAELDGKVTLQASFDADKQALQASVDQLTASETALKASVAELQAEVRGYRVADLKSRLVVTAKVLTADEFDAKADMLLGLPAEVIDLMARRPVETPQRMDASVETPIDDKVTITLS